MFSILVQHATQGENGDSLQKQDPLPAVWQGNWALRGAVFVLKSSLQVW